VGEFGSIAQPQTVDHRQAWHLHVTSKSFTSSEVSF
jgi:hypothetical protein